MSRPLQVTSFRFLTALTLVACSERSAELEAAPDAAAPSAAPGEITLRSEVTPVTRAEDALPGVAIPPFVDCRPPLPGDTAARPDGKVCTNVSIAGATEPGKHFADYASCDVVRTQRPYWPAPPRGTASPSDPRLSDTSYMAELAWAKEQIGATGCTCCHDSRVVDRASQWDIAHEPIWIDSISDTGLALFSGLADSSVLGAYPAERNNGFDRTAAGVPTTDPARMRAFALRELALRGRSEEWARSVPPFGGPIYEARVRKPLSCGPGQGVTPDGRILWTGGSARYVYVLEAGSENPGVPPNLDLPEGTVFRLDVLPNAPAVESGILYGRTPPGTFQAFPETTAAASLVVGRTYVLSALLDLGFPVTSCSFTFGSEPVPAPDAAPPAPAAPPPDAGLYPSAPDAGEPSAPDAGEPSATCSLPGGDADGFGAACKDGAASTDCTCAASYCAVQPGATTGVCTATGCKENPSVCPPGWSCLDLSLFSPGLPSICTK